MPVPGQPVAAALPAFQPRSPEAPETRRPGAAPRGLEWPGFRPLWSETAAPQPRGAAASPGRPPAGPRLPSTWLLPAPPKPAGPRAPGQPPWPENPLPGASAHPPHPSPPAGSSLPASTLLPPPRAPVPSSAPRGHTGWSPLCPLTPQDQTRVLSQARPQPPEAPTARATAACVGAGPHLQGRHAAGSSDAGTEWPRTRAEEQGSLRGPDLGGPFPPRPFLSGLFLHVPPQLRGSTHPLGIHATRPPEGSSRALTQSRESGGAGASLGSPTPPSPTPRAGAQSVWDHPATPHAGHSPGWVGASRAGPGPRVSLKERGGASLGAQGPACSGAR